MTPSNRLRIGDTEREAAVAALADHFAAGRLTQAELDQRMTAAWSARTDADLAPLFADLPGQRPGAAPTWAGQAWTGPAWTASSAYTGQGAFPPGWPLQRRRRPPFPWLVFLVLLVALTAVTHVPWFLLAIVLWMVLSRSRHRLQSWHAWRHPGGAGHSHGHVSGQR